MKTPEGIDLSTAAARIIDEMPTLEHLFLTTCGHTYVVPTKKGWPVFRKRTLESWLSTKAWRVDHRERDDVCLSDMGLDSCKELGAEVAERIMSREELHLSRHEQVSLTSDVPSYEALRKLTVTLQRCRTKCESAAARGNVEPTCDNVGSTCSHAVVLALRCKCFRAALLRSNPPSPTSSLGSP